MAWALRKCDECKEIRTKVLDFHGDEWVCRACESARTGANSRKRRVAPNNPDLLVGPHVEYVSAPASKLPHIRRAPQPPLHRYVYLLW